MELAYLLNQYPMPSLTFVRREIAALEALGWQVHRYSLRAIDGMVVDGADRAERTRTRAVLGERALLRLACATALVALRRPGALLRALRRALELGRGSERGVAVHLVYLAEACVLVRWFARAGIEHVHTHFGTNGPVVADLVQELGGPPFSFTVHGPEEFDRPEALRLREKVRAAAFVVVISSFGRSQLMRWSDVDDWSKIHVVRCGVDEAFLDAPIDPVPEVPRLVCVGRLGEQKGQLVLIEAAARLLEEGTPLELVLAGEGPMREVLEAAIVRAGVGGSITITGWIDNARVRDEIARSRALVLPSFAEGLPVVLMEALALGRPVITTAVAGIPELVDGECGWVVPAGSVDALAEAMRTALATPTDQLERMGRVGRERVRAQHDVMAEAEQLAKLFEGR